VTYAAEIAGINGHRLRNTTGGLETNRSIFFERTIPLLATTRENGLSVNIQSKEQQSPKLLRTPSLTKAPKLNNGVIKMLRHPLSTPLDRGNEN